MRSRNQSSAVPDGRIVVQLSLAPPDGTTKYVDQLVGGDTLVQNVYFTWRRALAGRYDVFHVHWPELMIRGRGRMKRFARRRALDVFLVGLRIRRIPLVRTVHNLEPHEPGPASERRSLGRVDAATDMFITLNATTPLPADRPAVLIPHGHYRDRFAAFALPPREAGRILYFGIIRPYKGVTELLDAFATVPDEEVSLRVVGSPASGMREAVTERADRDPRVSTVLRFIADADLVEEIGRAQLVVLPYREMHNSGAILVALSLSRPVLAPLTPAMTAIQQEVGTGWVRLYSGDLDAEVLTDALHWARWGAREAAPDLADRDWDNVRELHEAAYRRAIALLGQSRPGEGCTTEHVVVSEGAP